MVDELRDYARTSTDADDSKRRRSFLRVLVAVIVIVLIVLALLMMRTCTADKDAASGENGSKTIESVKGLDPQPGAVSVWATEGTDINALLTLAGVRSDDIVNMGGGRYVISVPEGGESAAVRRLTEVRGVIDAGLVYATGERR